jgi:valyl-tRNA synthetase
VNRSLENYRYDDAANIIYQFFWGSFCDWYLEIVKLRLDFSGPVNKALTTASLTTLVQVFETSLRLLSPFMPFITEEIWHSIYDGNPPAKSIALAAYPFEDDSMIDVSAINQMALIQSLIVEVRTLRKEIGVEEKAITPIEVRADATTQAIISTNSAIVERLARVSEIRFVNEISAGLSKHSTPSFDVAVVYERTIDVAADRARLTKEIAQLEKAIANAERQLGNEGFVSKAPPHVVEGLKKQLTENRALLDKARRDLDALPPE